MSYKVTNNYHVYALVNKISVCQNPWAIVKPKQAGTCGRRTKYHP